LGVSLLAAILPFRNEGLGQIVTMAERAAVGVVLAFSLRRQGVPPTPTAEPAGEQGLALAA